MDRRTFLAACAATATSGLLAASPAGAADASPKKATANPGAKPFANAPLKMAAPPDWFEGDSLPDQIAAMAAWGFPAYEVLGPEPALAPAMRERADAVGIAATCIVGVGAIAAGQMVLPSDHDRLEAQFRERILLARQLGCTRLIGLSGNTRSDATAEEQTKAIITMLERIAPIAEENGVTVIMEALNPLVDHQGYFLTRTDQTMAILKAVNSPNIKMLFDIYHQQITEGNVIRNLSANIERIGHFHVADNPGRNEPGTGELNYRNIFKAIHQAGYDGYVALELGPKHGPEAALRATLECLDWS